MSEKTLIFDNIRVNKKEFHKSQQLINLDLTNVNQIAVSDKFRHNDDGFKYFVSYKEGEIVKLNRYVLSYLKWLDTQNDLKMVAKLCLL